MNTPELQALLVDHHLGELSPEVTALLEAYLVSDPAARAESARIEETLGLTRRAVVEHPELVSLPLAAAVSPKEVAPEKAKQRKPMPAWLKVAAALTLAALTGSGGYLAGGSKARLEARAESKSQAPVTGPLQSRPATDRAVLVAVVDSGKSSPWAQYRVERQGQGSGLQITRIGK